MIVFLIGCVPTLNQKQHIDSYIRYVCEKLTSNEFEGRRTGTLGNKKAEEFLIHEYEKMGLEPYCGVNFAKSYSHRYDDIENLSCSFIIKFEDGTQKELAVAEDFIPAVIPVNLELDCEVIVEAFNDNLHNKAILVDEESKIKDLDPSNIILVKQSPLKMALDINDSGYSIFRISEKAYNELRSKKASIQISSRAEVRDIEANNIIGRIKGKDSTKAIVISAHFDHEGKLSDTIFPGAIDNASGVSALLEIAKNISQYSKNEKLKYDIVFCLFNGEEHYLQGSRAFADEIENDYQQAVNINIDCIGIKEGGPISILGDDENSEFLREDLLNYFTKLGYLATIPNKDFGGDHISFANNGIPSVYLGQMEKDDGMIRLIHTEHDTVDALDFTYIYEFAQSISNYLINNVDDILIRAQDEVLYEAEAQDNILTNNYENIEKVLKTERENLELNQLIIVEIDGELHKITKNSDSFSGLSEIQLYIPSIESVPDIKDYEIININVAINTKKLDKKYFEVRIPEREVNKVFDGGTLEIEDIRSIQVIYRNLKNTDNMLTIKYLYDETFYHYEDETIKLSKNYKGKDYNILMEQEKISQIEEMVKNENAQYSVFVTRTKIDDGIIKYDWFDNSLEKALEFVYSLKDAITSNNLYK